MAVFRLVPASALVVGVLSVLVPRSAEGRPTTYAAVSTVAGVADLVAGLGLLACGAAYSASGQHRWVGPVTVLLGAAWLASDWVGWDHGSPTARTAATVLAALLPMLLAHLAVVFPTGRGTSGNMRVLLWAGYLAPLALVLCVLLLRDPSLDQYCWSNCSDDVLAMSQHLSLARALDHAALAVAALTGVATAAWCTRRSWRATRVARRWRAGVLMALGGAAAADAAYRIRLLVDRAEDPARADFMVLFLVRSGLLVLVALTMARVLARNTRAVAEVERLAERLGASPPPGTLRDHLARSLGDEELAVAYWLPGSSRWVDDSGQAVEDTRAAHRTTTLVVRDGEPVARVTHDPALTALGDLSERIGAAARLAVDNERLQAQLRARLDDVRASRVRLVEAGDLARRHLERDLHDGLQHLLLGVAHDVRQAARATHDADLTRQIETADAVTGRALAELREVAHGVFPAILADAGLEAALHTLAERAPVELSLGAVSVGRLPGPVEWAAYACASAAVHSADGRGASYVDVTVSVSDGELAMVLRDDSPTTTPWAAEVADRVAALGGRLRSAGHATEVWIPCG